MPKLSDSMEEGKIIEWKVAEGDSVEEGDVLAEVESDKAVMELECFQNGVVREIVHGDEAEVPVGEVIAYIAEPGEEAPEAAEAEPAAEEEEAAAEEAAAEEEPAGEEAEEETVEEVEVTTEAEEGEAPEAEVEVEVEEAPEEEAPVAEAAPAPAEAEEVEITAYAKKLAEDRGVDYASLEGSGPDGLIVASDVAAAAEESRVIAAVEGAPGREPKEEEAAAEAAEERPAERAEEELPPLEIEEDEAEVEEAPFRLKTQARRVIASQHIIPHFYLTRGVDATHLMKLKDRLKEEHDATITHVVMYGCLRALEEHPEVNRSYDHGRVINWKRVNLGLAVDTERGLTVAVLKEAQKLGFDELVGRTRELVDRAREGKLSGEERRHATFTVTNLGPMDVEHFEPIINPPSSITLAVSSALPSAVVKDEAVILGHVMKLTAACDHRIIEGATAARFVRDLRLLLEDPESLLNGD